MTDQNTQTPTNAAADPNAPLVNAQAIYIKDCSFESPNGPFVAASKGQPAVNLNISTRATALAQDVHEVVLQINLEAKAGDKVVVAARTAAGRRVHHPQPVGDRRRPGAVDHGAELPARVRARRRSSDLVIKGGFPPFLLPLVTFEGLHARAASSAAAAGARRGQLIRRAAQP